MLVTLEGNLEPERIERAINAAYAANESTMSRIVLEADGSAYYDRLEASGCWVSVDDILFIPPNVSYTRQMFGAASLGDTLTLCRSDA